MKKLSIVTLVYNEEQALPIYLYHLNLFKIQLSNYEIEWFIVDDGSSDTTSQFISDYANS